MGVVSQCFAGATTASLTKLLSMIARRNFRYSQTRALSFLAINCKMEPQKHATRFDLRYDIYSGLWCHKPMKELGFECDFVKLGPVVMVVTPTAAVLSSPSGRAEGDGRDKDEDEAAKGEADPETEGEP